MNKQIISGTVTSSSNSQTGRRRISVVFDTADYEQDKKDLFDSMFKNLPVSVAVAVISDEAAAEDMSKALVESEPEALYGDQARILRLSAFFRTPTVWKAIGTDDEFLKWVRSRHCCLCKGNLGLSSSEAAHVRRVANGSGMGIKPIYSAIPLCHTHHMEQHNQGEETMGGKEMFDKLRIKYVSKWAWDALKEILDCSSWKFVNPDKFIEWCKLNNVEKFIPAEYLSAD